MELARARLRSLYQGSVFNEDLILCTQDEWAEALRLAPSFAAWRVAAFPNGLVVAVEPIAGLIDRLIELSLVRDSHVPHGGRKAS